VFFAPAADASYVVYQWTNQSGTPLAVGVSQADAAKLATAFDRIGECEAYEDACLAVFVAYYRPECLPYIKTMTAADKKARKDWITPARLKQYAAERFIKSVFFLSAPQPYNSKMDSKTRLPFGFNITDGHPLYGMIDMLNSANLNIHDKTYKINVRGENHFTDDVRSAVAAYDWERRQHVTTPKVAVERVNGKAKNLGGAKFDEIEIQKDRQKDC
jgi:hypothetical protein